MTEVRPGLGLKLATERSSNIPGPYLAFCRQKAPVICSHYLVQGRAPWCAAVCSETHRIRFLKPSSDQMQGREDFFLIVFYEKHL